LIKELEKKFTAWINGLTTENIRAEALPKKNGDVSVVMKGDIHSVKKYVYGDELFYAEFELKTRVTSGVFAPDTAAKRLEDIADLCEQSIKPTIATGITVTDVFAVGLPKLTNRINNGDDEYSVLMRILWTEDK